MRLLEKILPRLRSAMSARRIVWLAPLLGGLLTLTSVFSGYAGDDFFHRMVLQDFPGMPEIAAHPGVASVPWDTFTFAPGDAEGNRLYVERGLLPWWSAEDVLFRRLHFPTSVTHWLDMVWFGHRAWAEHFHNVILYVLAAAAAGLVFRRLVPVAWVAGLATLLYAVDDAHGMTVAWIMNRNALHGAIFGYLALAAHIRWRQTGWRWGLPVAWISLAVGVACSEGTLSIGAYLFAHMLFLDKPGSLPARFARLLPYAGLVVIWRLAYDWLGFGVKGSGIYVDLGSDLGLFGQKVATNLPVLLLSLFAAPNPVFAIGLPGVGFLIYSAIAAALVALLFIALLPVLRARAEARFFALGSVLCTIPFCATLPDHRLLLFSGLGAMGLVAVAVQHAGESLAAGDRRLPRPLGYAVAALLFFSLVKSPLLLPLESLRFAFNFRAVSQSVATLPSSEEISEKTLVIVRAPSDWFLLHIPQIRSAERLPLPRHLYTLCVGPGEGSVTTIDDRTLEIALDDSFISDPWATMFGRNDEPFARTSVPLDKVTIQIVERNVIGLPVRVRFLFADRLNDPNLVMMTYTRGGYDVFLAPPVGDTIQMAPIAPRDLIAPHSTSALVAGAGAL